MSEDFEKFMGTIQNHNTYKNVKSKQFLGDYDYSSCTQDDLERIVLSDNPKSLQSIIHTCYILGLYARYLHDDRLYHMVRELDKGELWDKAKPNAPKKFISHKLFEEIYHDIGVYEERNGFYTQTLFRCLYEGIYNDDMSVIKNLKASDVHGNIVTLTEDNGHVYDLSISDELASDLIELGALQTCERKNRHGIFQMRVEGPSYDSCFKVEIQKKSTKYNYRYSYYRVLRYIAKDYAGYSLLPLQIYVSGIMYRIRLVLEDHHITMEDAFSEHNRDRLVGKIIADELARCNYDIDVKNFRMIVKGHIDVFSQ